MQGLDSFILKIEDFHNLTAAKKIDFFAYYLLIENKNIGITSKQIEDCFDFLHIKPYSNISGYLNTNSKGRKSKYLKKDSKYFLERVHKESLDKGFGKIPLPNASVSNFLPLELFNDTRGYLLKIAEQAINSYDLGLYDACSVLTRKLTEILIIECFERHQVENLIRKPDNSFYFLSDLITELLKEPKWNIGRNAKQSIPKIKKIGDLSAHNRRYIARQHDLDTIKHDLRIVIEELIHIVDYKNWK